MDAILSQSNCRIIAVKPQMQIEGILRLAAKDEDKGSDNEKNVPPKAIQAARLPLLIRANSLCLVALTYIPIPNARIKQATKKCDSRYGNPEAKLYNTIDQLSITIAHF